jgi:hypothetical protein
MPKKILNAQRMVCAYTVISDAAGKNMGQM